MASSDLGGLGARDGSGTVCQWTPPNPAPVVLPWLGILALLLLKPNRRGAAWWILAPLLCLAAAQSVLQSPASSLDDAFGMFAEAGTSLAFGLAAVWLLARQLGGRHPVLTFLGTLGVLAGSSLLAFGLRQGKDLASSDTLQISLLLLVGVLILAAALRLTGWWCRRRPAAMIYLWLSASLLGLCAAVVLPLFLISLALSGGQIPFEALVIGWLFLSGFSFAVLLPFLILSSVNSFFRERLRCLLNLPGECPPVINVPVPSAGPGPGAG